MNKIKIQIIEKNKSKWYCEIKSLDKITAKTSNVNIPLEKRKFGYLKFILKICLFKSARKSVVAYSRKRFISKNDDKVFVFNGGHFHQV